VNEALVAPAATVTDDETLAALELLLDRVTLAPAGPAGAFSVIVPIDVAPPVTDVGESDSDWT
jgi:hypothetical protein